MKLIVAIIRPFKLDAVPGERVERAVEAIRLAATTGRIGDGKIFILDMAQAVRIRTGETHATAL